MSCINYDPTQVKSRLGHCPYKALIHTVHMLKTIHIELFLSLSLLSLCIQAPFSGVFLCPSSTKHFLRLPTCLQRDKVFHLHNALHFFFFFWQRYSFSSISWYPWFSIHSIDIEDLLTLKTLLPNSSFSQACALSLRGI